MAQVSASKDPDYLRCGSVSGFFHFVADPDPNQLRCGSGSASKNDTDPDPAFQFDADPDFYFNANPDRLPKMMRTRIRNTLF